jgi:hypothetical protein
MTYIASPRTDLADPARTADCRQCVENAFNQLRVTSDESQLQQDGMLIGAGVAAGWEETELTAALQELRSGQSPMPAQPDLAPEASSLSIQAVERTAF